MTPPPELVAPPDDPWLARRQLTFGASDVPALLVAYGRRDGEAMTRTIRANANLIQLRGLPPTPRLLLEKAGLRRPLKSARGPDTPRARGQRLEQQLLREWRVLVGAGQVPDAELLDAASVTHAAAVPREFFPLIDRRCPSLSATPDGWAYDVLGGLVLLEAKCTVHAAGAPRPHHVLQVQTQLAVTDCTVGLIVEGEGWGAAWKAGADGPSGPIRTWPVERDDEVIAEIREVATEAAARVRELREHVGDREDTKETG
jgi:hypothetical protein